MKMSGIWIGLALSLCLTPVVVGHETAEWIEPDALAGSTVEADIEELNRFYRPAKAAAARLSLRGETVLPKMHAALLAPTASGIQRQQLITVLGEIGHPSSVEPVLNAAKQFGHQPAVLWRAFTTLPFLTEDPVASELADAVLKDANALPAMQMRALGYLAQVRDDRFRKHADRFRAHSVPELRTAALWYGARLGSAGVADQAEEMLRGRVTRNQLRDLLLAYSEAVAPERFQTGVPDRFKAGAEYRTSLAYARFRTGAPAAQTDAARTLMDSPYRFEKVLAARHLVRQAGAESVTRDYGVGGPSSAKVSVARHALRKEGYRVGLRQGRLTLNGRQP